MDNIIPIVSEEVINSCQNWYENGRLHRIEGTPGLSNAEAMIFLGGIFSAVGGIFGLTLALEYYTGVRLGS